jgi:hypothetical protein
MTFGDVYKNLLSPFVEKYKVAKNDKGRRAVTASAAKVVLESSELLEDQGFNLPKDLPAVCLYFFIPSPFLLIIIILGYQ